MALGFTPVPDGDNVEGRFRTRMMDVALDNNYQTGGYAITGANVGLRRIGSADIIGVKGTIANASSLMFSWDRVNGKLVAEYPTGGGTVPAAIGVPAISAGGVAVTSLAANGTTDITAGQAAQVANGTDLSTITLTVLFKEF